MRFVVSLVMTLSMLLPAASGSAAEPQGQVDVNRPRSIFDCQLPTGKNWYGSESACLAELCAGQNVYNEYIFDADGRRRKNPCYGQSATEFPAAK